MFGAGILYITNTTFYLNGKKIAESKEHFFNRLCLHPLPHLMIVYIKDFSEDLARDIKTSLKRHHVIIYKRIKPFIYVHHDWYYYTSTFFCGLLIGFLLAAIRYLLLSPPSLDTLSTPSISYQQVITKGTTICGPSPCVEQLGIFPTKLMFHINHPPNQLPSLCEQKGRIIQCRID